MLTLEMELLTGAYRAALPDGSGAEWPPHPERVFSALVQAWADGGCDPGERVALEWLEAQAPPAIEASASEDTWVRDAPVVYVPPNDPRGDEVEVLPERRRRQARDFCARIAADTTVRLRWRAEAPPHERLALERLASRIASVGHSASFVRCAFRQDDSPIDCARTWLPDDGGSEPVRVVYQGRLADLERWYSSDGKPQERPRSRSIARYRGPTEPAADVPSSTFGGVEDWFVFEGVGGLAPDIVAFAHVARRVRDALMSLGPQPPPELLSGHAANGEPSQRPHVAVVPLANVGTPYATGDLLGFAVVLPRACDAVERRAVLGAIATFAKLGSEDERARLQLTERAVWLLSRAPSAARTSLRPARYCRASRAWASVLPVVLDRFPDHGDVLDEARTIATACRNIGLPEPVAIELHKHAAIQGAPPAYLSRARGRRPSWSFSHGSKLRDRPRRHVVVRFEEPVRGPVVLGAGRYQGFGLCLPVEGAES
jgi:CRISPR-associated protein Csb2